MTARSAAITARLLLAAEGVTAARRVLAPDLPCGLAAIYVPGHRRPPRAQPCARRRPRPGRTAGRPTRDGLRTPLRTVA